MSRSFDGSGDRLVYSGALVSAPPFTFATWFKRSAISSTQYLLNACTQDTTNHSHRLAITSANSFTASSTDTLTSNSSGHTLTDTASWHHVAGVWASTTSRRCYLDGTGDTANTTSRTPSGIDRFKIGAGGGEAQVFNGLVAHSAVWGVALTADEIAMLAAGLSPLLIRPASLLAYWPYLGRDSTEIDIVGRYGLAVTGTAASADEPRLRWPSGRRVIYVPAAGGQSAATGRADESDTALALSRIRFISTGIAVESNSAFALAKLKLRAVGLANETDTALAFARVKIKGIGLASELDTSLGLAKLKIRSIGISNEIDTAIALSFGGKIGMAVETDTAFSLAKRKVKSIGLASDISTALALTKVKVRGVGVSSETDSSLALAKSKIRAVGLSTSVNSALALAKSKLRSVAFANESNTAFALQRIKFRAMGMVESANIALAPSIFSGSTNAGFSLLRSFRYGASFVNISTGLASEIDSAYALTRVKFKSVGFAQETDIALSLGTGMPGLYPLFRFLSGVPAGTKFVPTGIASSTNSSLALGVIRQPTKFMVRWAQETPVASSLAKRKIRAYGIATSTSLALAPSIGRRYAVGLANSTNLAIAPTLGDVRALGIAVEVDSAHLLVYRKLISTKIAESFNQALAMVAPKFIVVGTAVGTNTALALTTFSTHGVGLASETDTAFALRPSRLRVTGLASEIDTAFALNNGLITSTKLSQSFNTSFALERKKVKIYGIATSTNIARAPMLQAMMAREKDVACFLEMKRNGIVVYPAQIPHRERRIWASTFS